MKLTFITRNGPCTFNVTESIRAHVNTVGFPVTILVTSTPIKTAGARVPRVGNPDRVCGLDRCAMIDPQQSVRRVQ